MNKVNAIMKIFQQQLQLKERKRGFHLITEEIIQALPQIHEIETGICQVFIQHTSASLTINEDADPTVRKDFEIYFNNLFLMPTGITSTKMKALMTCLLI